MTFNIKSIIIFILFITILTATRVNAFETNKSVVYRVAQPIEDELLRSERFNHVLPVYAQEKPPIIDEAIEPFQQAGQTLMIWAQKKGEKNSTQIDDELITSNFKKKNNNPMFLKKHKNIIEDSFVKNSLDLKNISLLKKKDVYDFSKKQIPIELKVIKNISTKKDIKEGQTITFKTIKDVVINGKVLPKGTKVTGRVEMVSESDKMGTPFNIILDNFTVKDAKIDNTINLYGTVTKAGANRSLWVYPLYQAGNLVLYVAGFAFVPIHGGHAKLLTSETYTVFYETR